MRIASLRILKALAYGSYSIPKGYKCRSGQKFQRSADAHSGVGAILVNSFFQLSLFETSNVLD